MALSVPRFSVKPGLCQSLSFRECWLSGSDCNGTFVSGMQMIGVAGPYAHCPLHGTLTSMALGQCRDQLGTISPVCAPNDESCTRGRNDTTWSFEFPTSSSSCQVSNTKFGSCTRSSDDSSTTPICRFAPDQCPPPSSSSSGSNNDNHAWTFPHEDCPCENVQVGACQNKLTPSLVVCAIEGQACDEQQSVWIPPHQVRSELGLDCFLCRADNSNSNTDNNNLGGNEDGGSSNNNNNSNVVLSAPKNTTTNGVDNSNNTDAVLIGSMVGAAVVVLLVMGWLLARWILLQKRAPHLEKDPAEDSTTKSPLEDFVISGGTGAGINMGGVDDDDNVSVL